MDKEYVFEICKLGKFENGKPLVCAYLGMGSKGWCCLKNDPSFGKVIEKKLAGNKMKATSVNCPGYQSSAKN